MRWKDIEYGATEWNGTKRKVFFFFFKFIMLNYRGTQIDSTVSLMLESFFFYFDLIKIRIFF